MTMEFPARPFPGWGKEAGYNAIYFWTVSNCWVKDVSIINADNGVVMDGCNFCSVRGTVSFVEGA